MICGYCNTYNKDNNKFCQYCGKPIDSSSNIQANNASSQSFSTNQEQSNIGNKSDVLMGFQPLAGSVPNETSRYPEPIPPQASFLASQTSPKTDYPRNTPAQANYPPPFPPQFPPNQITQAHYPHQNPQHSKQPHFAKPPRNKTQIILSILGIALLLIGILSPSLSLKPNIGNGISSFLEIFGVDSVMDYSNTKLSYNFVSMMAGKPPKISARGTIGELIKKYMENELNQLFNQVKNVNTAYQDDSGLVLRKTISSLQTAGIIFSVLTLLLVICVILRLINPESSLFTLLVSLLGTLLIILLIVGLIYIKTFKVDLGPLGSYIGFSKVNLSQLVLISPAVGYFLLVIGSISAVSSAFMKQP